MTDFANHDAADTAGYVRTQTDRGAGESPRYATRYEKPIVGQPHQAGGVLKADGEGASQEAADTQALAALNVQRIHRYGGADASAGDGSAGGDLTFDLH